VALEHAVEDHRPDELLGRVVEADHVLAAHVLAAAAFHREERLQRLSAKPSEILQRQFFATPYPHENVGWIVGNVGEDMCLFSSDYPHIEGGRNPLKRFNESLDGCSETAKRKFYRDNFIQMMGAGLAPALHDAPHAVAA